MKYLMILLTMTAFATAMAEDKQSISPKVVRILNALNLGSFPSESDMLTQLTTSCQNNACTTSEHSQVKELGLRLIHCQLPYLNSKGIENSDAQFLCRPKQAILSCDTLSTPLMRKMCYTGNQYSLKVLSQKEKLFQQKRLPASQ